MKAEMPWLQLEDEDLDAVQSVPAAPKKAVQPAEVEMATIIVVSGTCRDMHVNCTAPL